MGQHGNTNRTGHFVPVEHTHTASGRVLVSLRMDADTYADIVSIAKNKDIPFATAFRHVIDMGLVL